MLHLYDRATMAHEFRCIKARGDNAERAAYAYAGEAGVDYADLLTSVRQVDPEQVDDLKRIEEQRSDADLIAVVADCIGAGMNTKMVLAKEVASRASVSAREAGRLLDRYAGNDPTQHRWRYARGERGAHVFELLPSTADSAAPPA